MTDLRALTRELALASSCGNLGTLYLHVQCGCQTRIMGMHHLPVEATLGAVIGRLRCSKCRGAPVKVLLAEDQHGPHVQGMIGVREGWWIKLAG